VYCSTVPVGNFDLLMFTRSVAFCHSNISLDVASVHNNVDRYKAGKPLLEACNLVIESGRRSSKRGCITVTELCCANRPVDTRNNVLADAGARISRVRVDLCQLGEGGLCRLT
jgi:hypothetical protein